MLLSMTGFGAASLVQDHLTIQVEVRAVNNRHLKLSVRGTEPYPLLEAEFEKVARRHVRRGSLLVQVRVKRPQALSRSLLNEEVLRGYLNQLDEITFDLKMKHVLPELTSGVLALPGVANDSTGSLTAPENEWPLVEQVLEQAFEAFNKTRAAEGQAMADELLNLKASLVQNLQDVEEFLPAVMTSYRQRLFDRIQSAVQQAGAALKPEDLIRELALYADRTDVSEEITRLKNHLIQYDEIVKTSTDGAGRRLEFIVQEIGREVNTTGSKAGSAEITKRVVEMKATLEKIRELIQNVE